MSLKEKYLKFINATDPDADFEKILIQSISFVGMLISLLSGAINISLGLNAWMTSYPVLSFLIYGYFFIKGRKTKNVRLMKILVTLFTLFTLNFIWLNNFGSHGPAVYFFVFVFSFFIFIWNGRELVYFNILMGTNVAILFFMDYFYPALTGTYQSHNDRIIDIYLSVIMFAFLMLTLMNSTKRNYVNQYEKAKRSDELKSAFLANMSHEIRTPMNAILGFSSLLSESDLLDEERKQYSAIVNENGDSLMRIIEDILDISKIESNQLTLIREECRVNKAMEKMSIIYQNVLKQKGKEQVQIKLSPPTNDITIITDKLRIQQVIKNLMDNAIKYTDQGCIEFSCKEDNDKLLFCVQDSGIGIKEEDFERIFTRFTKLNDTKANIYPGTGIGLFLCKHLVSILGGKIWFKSEYKKGTSFYFTIPKVPIIVN